jgi:hypothetical protein
MESESKKSSFPDLTWLSVGLLFIAIFAVLILSSGNAGPFWGPTILYSFWIFTILVSIYNTIIGAHKKINAGIIIGLLLIPVLFLVLGALFGGLRG